MFMLQSTAVSMLYTYCRSCSKHLGHLLGQVTERHVGGEKHVLWSWPGRSSVHSFTNDVICDSSLPAGNLPKGFWATLYGLHTVSRDAGVAGPGAVSCALLSQERWLLGSPLAPQSLPEAALGRTGRRMSPEGRVAFVQSGWDLGRGESHHRDGHCLPAVGFGHNTS